ncbi:dTDP-4-dehydrorhamnose reductase [Cobetia sp. AM6]|uniref:dTDP-4-dehydrorhamnose reductase n=1 Tax=Cobetia sp. AM6 TaxID=2661553 RepID=UPI00129922EE|nr:dTDP-4-dehydrorhamnose reductase [Cobetia sp. AM6]BBO56822.1 NAD(P)-dependent oxidoreductase [Cobetia sp. AM6]
MELVATRKILLLGGTGQLGVELQSALADIGQVYAPTREDLDVGSFFEVSKCIDLYQPDIILNAAAYTAVDKAEVEVDNAMLINASLPSLLAKKSSELGAILIHYSSDYVYPGTGSTPWTEESDVSPLSVYGRSKLAGDESVLSSHCRHWIFRTSWIYAPHGNNFMRTMLRLGVKHDSLRVVHDQIGAPTPAKLIAQVTSEAIRQQIPTGLYHLTAGGSTSWHGFAQAIFRHAISRGIAFKIHPDNVEGISTQDYPTPARRPLNSRLSSKKLETELGLSLPAWDSQLILTLNEFFEENYLNDGSDSDILSDA